MFKRLVAAATAVVLTVAMSISAFAATTEATRTSILGALKANGLPETDDYYKQAEQFLSRTDVTITTEQASELVTGIGELKQTLKADGIKNLAEFKEKLSSDSAFATKITDQVNTVAKKAGITSVVIDPKTGTITKFVYNNKTFVPNASGDFAPTGVDFSTTAAVVAGLGLSVAGIAVIAKKKDLVNA